MPQYQQYPSRREIATQERQARKEQEHAMRASRHQEVMYSKQQRHQQHSMQRQPSPRRSTTSFSPRASYDAMPSSYMQVGATSPRGGAVLQVSAGRSPDLYRDPQHRGGTSGSGTGEMYRGDVYRSGDSYQRTSDPYRSGDPYGSTGGHSGYAQPVRQQPQRYAEPPHQQQQQAYRREEGSTGDGVPREEKSGSSFLSKFGGKVQKMFNVNKNAGTRDASSLQGRPSQDGSQGGRRHSSGGGGYPPPGHVRRGSNAESVGAAAALPPQQPLSQQQPSLATASGPVVVQPRGGGGGGSGPTVVQPRGGDAVGGAPAGLADMQQVYDLQQRIASLEVQLSQSEAQRKAAAADAKSGTEWRDKWNYQNFKLNLLVDMLVLRVLDLDDGDTVRAGSGGGGGGGGPRLIKRAPPPPDVAEAELREDSIEDY